MHGAGQLTSDYVVMVQAQEESSTASMRKRNKLLEAGKSVPRPSEADTPKKKFSAV